MLEFSRRRFLQSGSALAVAGTASGGALSAPAGQAAPAPPARPTKLADIDHIIIMMKENRSFDHYFGTLSGVRGFSDPKAARLSGGGSVFEQPDAAAPAKVALPFRLDTTRTSAQRLADLDHGWAVQHASFAGGRMNGWLAAHRAYDGGRGPLTMGYLTRADLPYYHALADAFTICDGYFCSVLGPTFPNRFFAMTGSIDAAGGAGGPQIDNQIRPPLHWETYPERLEAAGISWRIYHDFDDYNCNVCKFLRQYRQALRGSPLRENALRDRPLYELLHDLRTGNIPQVSWIVPSSFVCEHPDYLPAAGEHHTSLILSALWSNPSLWARTAFIIHYDENDGLFDHVQPPTPEPGTADEFVAHAPIGLGFRVPCLVMSPFSRGGYVCSETFDHTSTLRLIERRWGVEVANLSAWRRATCGDLTTAFGFGEPARYDLPDLPETVAALARAEHEAMTLPPPAPPANETLPSQEPGKRPRRGVG
jgi:phospholipase C